MKSDISDRHRGDLGGRLTGDRAPARVTVSMSREAALSPTAQHLAWMLINLLARQTDEVREIVLDVPRGVACIPRLGPLVPSFGELVAALGAGVTRINTSVLRPQLVRSTVSVRIGAGEPGDADLRLTTTAGGWSGYVGRLTTDVLGDDGNPVGAYVAAALCAGEVFKFVRGMRAEAGSFAERLWLDAYSFRVSEHYATTPSLPRELSLQQTVLAGVGAVANGFLHTLYAVDGLSGDITAIDGDEEGVTDTNLNRYTLFGLSHAAALHLKASTAASMFAGGGIKVRPYDGSWQQWREEQSDMPLGLVISAVDKNTARHAIQDALPRLILGASTKDMRAQVNLYDVIGGGPCLRCRNRPETALADDVIIDRLRGMSAEVRAAEAARAGVHARDLETFLADPRANCGKISGTTLQKFGGGETAREWSVGFVSVMAGVLQAAEYLKLNSHELTASLNAHHNTFRFQFWRPGNVKSNQIITTPPEEDCLCQSPLFRRAVGDMENAA